MLRCPHCSSTNCTLVDKHNRGDGVHAAHVAMHGYPIFAGVVWLMKKASDAMQDTYKCKSCGQTFS